MTHSAPGNGHLDANQVNAYVDGELSSNEVQQCQQHLTACHACAMLVLSALQIKNATVRAADRYVAPPETLHRLASQLRPQEPRKVERHSKFRAAAWATLAASVMLAILLTGWQTMRRSNALSAELIDQHLMTLSSGAVPGIISTDRHTVKPWFQGRLPFSFNLPDAWPVDAVLKGADLAYLNGQPAALLLFTIHKHEVSIFLVQRSVPFPTLVPHADRSGFAVHSATTHDLRMIAVSDVNPSDLDRVLSALADAQSPQ